MTKRKKILNECIVFGESVTNPTKNFPSHMAMRRYADEFAKWCFQKGVYLAHDNLYILNGKKMGTEDILEVFDPST